MDPTRLDLNLLRIFHQLLKDGGVSPAAQSLGLSQPAVSHALRRLRLALGDALFLRTPTGMRPTPYAQDLAEPVARALALLSEALRERAPFEPTRTERCFTLAMNDVGQIYFLPRLLRALDTGAPGVTLRAVVLADTALAQAMATGQIDLALGLLPQLQAGFYQQVLLRQHYVCLMRGAHRLAVRSTLGRADFLAAEHVRVQADGTGHGRVDDLLDQKGLARRVRLTVPDYVALGHVLAGTDLLATVPERLAERLAAPMDLATRELPLRLAASTIGQFWHARGHQDAGNQWLRALIAELFGAPDR